MEIDYSDYLKDPNTNQPREWWTHPPVTLDKKLYVLSTRAAHIRDKTDEGAALRRLLEQVEASYNETIDEVRRQYPIAYFRPSYEQSLLLNAWIWGIDFVVCFAANRIGKTTALGVINPCLWIFPNNPDWECFSPTKSPNPQDESAPWIDNPLHHLRRYTDFKGRPVQVLPRPSIESLDIIRFTLRLHPELMGDPTRSHLDPENAEKFTSLQQLIPEAFTAAWPSPPIRESGTIWIGAPDNGFHRDIIFKEWKRWLPQRSIKKWTESELYFDLDTTEATNPTPTEFRCICKSYESDDTKWSGAAVHGIVLTEGLTQEVLNEIKQRIKVNGFGSWDYTPYEARNVGGKTALAYKVFKGTEQLPLRAHIFTRFSARNAPSHILPTSKRDDLVRMWDGKKEGDARLDGIFYSSSPLVLSRLDRPFHCLGWTREELFDRYPNGRIYRGLDPGYDHPSVCAWGLLIPGNVWIIYRYYVERLKTISERCKDIITLSGNIQLKRRWGPRPEQFRLEEAHMSPTSEVVLLTATDYHMFKTDEQSGQPYSINYIKTGLNVVEGTHMRPEDRATDFDNKLDKSNYHTHPQTKRTPGSRIFFLTNGPGVDQALGKMESLFWDRLQAGPNKGEPKDKVPVHGDDELDATCYLVCAPYTWTTYQPPRNDRFVDEEEEEFTSL
jgi:hypothetical protein